MPDRQLIFQYVATKHDLPEGEWEPSLLRRTDGLVYGVTCWVPHVAGRIPMFAGFSDPIFMPGTHEFLPGDELWDDPARPLSAEKEDLGVHVRISVWRASRSG